MKQHAILASAFCVLFVGPLTIIASFLVYMMFRPIDITTLVKPFLPLVIMSDEGTGEPIASVDLRNAQLRWNGLKHGLHDPVSVALKDLTFSVTSSRFPNFIKEADVTFDPIALMNKSLKLRSVTITEAQLGLRRDKNNRIGFDFNKPLPLHHHKKHTILDFSKLTEIHFERTFLNWHEERNETSWQLSDITADLYDIGRARKQGVVGSASFNLASWNFPGLLLSLDARSLPYDRKSKKIRWSVITNPVNPASLTSVSPALANYDLPISLESTFTLSSSNPSEWLLPDTSNIVLHMGKGHIHALGSTYRINRGIANFGVFLDYASHKEKTPFRVIIPSLSLIVINPSAPNTASRNLSLQMDGQITGNDIIHPKNIHLWTKSYIPNVEFSDLHHFWPEKAGKGGRKWVTNNITAGTASNLSLALSMESDKGFKHLALRKIRGGLDGKHLTVHWLRPITPLRDMNARLDIDDPNRLVIHYADGYQAVPMRGSHNEHMGEQHEESGENRIEAGPGVMYISELKKRVPMGTIRTQFRGDLGNVKRLLSEPRLHLLSKHPISITEARGLTNISFYLNLPLTKHAQFRDMSLGAHANVHDGFLKNAVIGRNIHEANMGLDIDKSGISVNGRGTIANFPSDIEYSRNFKSDPANDIREKAHLFMNITPENADNSGIKLSPYFINGTSKLNVNYISNIRHQGKVAFYYDLGKAGISTPIWTKSEGIPASITTNLYLSNGHVSQIDKIQGTAPNFSASGLLNIKNPNRTELTIPSFLIGESSGQGHVTFFSKKENEKIYASIAAKKIVVPSRPHSENEHASHLANSMFLKALTENNLQEHLKPWTINLTADQILLKKTSLRSVKAFAENNGHHLSRFSFEIRDPVPLTLRLMPNDTGRSLHLFVPDLGEFLNDFKMAKNVKGGRLSLDGMFDDKISPSPFDGKLEVSPFVVEKAPASVKTASNISLYGWLTSQLSDNDTKDFQVNYFKIPLHLDKNIVTMHDATAGNESLSATMVGYALLQNDELNCHGTVVPISTLNTLPGQIPGLGKIFSPEKNGGLFSITFKIGGTIYKPMLHVNPFSLFAPGALRNNM